MEVPIPFTIEGTEYVIVDFGAVTRAKAHFVVKGEGQPRPVVRIGLLEALEDWNVEGDCYAVTGLGACGIDECCGLALWHRQMDGL